MKRTFLLLVIISIAFLPAILMGQTVIPVTEGTDQISAALANAQDHNSKAWILSQSF